MPGRKRLELVVFVLAATLACGEALAGEIAGVLKCPERVTSVAALDRVARKSYAAEFDAKTGEYRVKDLPPGTYDLVLETTAGRIEGLDLSLVKEMSDSVFYRQLGPSDLDRREIARIAARLVQIYAEKRKEKLDPMTFIARVREGKFAGVQLVVDTPREVPLDADETVEVGDAVLGLAAIEKARDPLPRDYDLHAGLNPPSSVSGLKATIMGDLRLIEVEPELTEKDRAWIVDWVDHLKLFENKKRVLDMFGTGEHARVLVELLRDDDAGPTTLDVKEPTAFWRVEIWEFNKHYGGWTKDKATVVVREQTPIRVFRTYRRMFEKRLGGIRVPADGTATVAPYDVPEKPDPAKGRVPY